MDRLSLHSNIHKQTIIVMGNCNGASDTGRGHELDFAPEENAVRARFIEAGQGHVFNGFGDLNEAEKQNFLQQCCQFDVNQVN